MNVLSLFDGMSCGRIALEELDMDVENYFASEINKYAIEVTQDNYPDTIQIGDIKELDERPYLTYLRLTYLLEDHLVRTYQLQQ